MTEGSEGTRTDERVDASEAASRAVSYTESMTGSTPEVVSAVEPAEEGWLVTVEVLELGRIPDSSDILGCYQVTVDQSGAPVSYRRLRRYLRGRADDG